MPHLRTAQDRRLAGTRGVAERTPVPVPQVQDGGFLGGFADLFRTVTPQGFRDVLGAGGQAVARGFGELDRPLSERLGFQFGDDPLFFDEIGNFLLEEATRPTNVLFALGGAGAAARVGRAGFRGAGLAANLLAPVGGTNFATRFAAETALATGARAGSEAAERALPEGTPLPARLALGLVGGVAGGVGVVGALRSGVRRAIGRDLLAPPNITGINVTPTTVEAGQRRGVLLRAQTTEQLGADFSVKNVVRVARDLERQSDAQADVLVARGAGLLRRLGRTATDSTGNLTLPGVAKLDGTTAYLQEVLEAPDRFNLTPANRRLVEQIQTLFKQVRDERVLFDVGPDDAELIVGQSFIARRVVEKQEGAVRPGQVVGGRRLGGGKDRLRTFTDPADAIANGIVYDNPLQALDDYARRGLKLASDAHVASLLKPFGQTAADRASSELRGAVMTIRSKITGRRLTLVRRQARTQSAKRELARLEKSAEGEFGRVETRAVSLDDLLEAKPTAQDVIDVRRAIPESIADGRSLVREIEENASLLRQAKRKLTSAERKIVNRAKNLRDQLDNAEGVRAAGDSVRDRLERGLAEEIGPAQLGEEARLLVAGQDSLDREWAKVVRQADKIERQIDSLSDDAADMSLNVNNLSERGELLKELDFNARNALSEVRKSDRALREQNAVIRVAERELKALEGAQRRATRQAERAGRRLSETEARELITTEEFDQLREDLRGIKQSWKLELQRATAVPEGRAPVPTQVAPLLAGRDFAEADAKAITNWYKRGLPAEGQLGLLINAIRKYNRIFIPIRAIGDASATLNQLAAFFPSNPKTFMKNFALSLRDSVNFSAYDDYLAANAEDAAAHGIAILGRGGRSLSDFEFENWIERIPGWLGGPVWRATQRHFQAITTRNRIDIYNGIVERAARSGKPLDDLAREQVARSMNRLSGIATDRAGDAETIGLFAPNFFRSTIESINAAVKDGTIEGQLARKYLRDLFFASTMLSVGVAVAQNRDPREVLNPFNVSALERGEIRLNPNFLTVRVAGQDVAPLGRFDSLARLAFLAADVGRGVISEQSAAPFFEGLEFFARTKGSPFISTGTSVVTGTTFTGNSPASLEGLAGEFLPFTASAFIEDARSGFPLETAVVGGAVNFFGAKANPSTPFEQLQIAASARFGKQLDELTGTERVALEESLPRITEQFKRQTEDFARRGDEKAQARLRRDEIDSERLSAEEALTTAFSAGELSRRQFGDALSEALKTASVQKEEGASILGVDFLDSRTDAGRALSAWYDLYDLAKLPGTDVVDFERRDELEAQLFRAIAAGDFGEPVAARQAIEQRRRPEHANDVVRQHFAAKDYISQSQYYEIRDDLFVRFVPRAQLLDPNIQSYNDLLKAINRAELDGDVSLARRLGRLRSRVDSVVSERRELLRRRDRTLNAALVLTGRVSATSRLAVSLGR